MEIYKLIFILAAFLVACHSSKGNLKRNISVEDNLGVKTRIETVNRELSSDLKTRFKPKALNTSNYSTPQINDGVSVIKRTAEEFEFEAIGEGLCTKYDRLLKAEKRAEEDALSKAVRKSGVNVYSGFQNVMEEYGDTQYQFIGKYINVWSSSLVEYEKVGVPKCSLAGDVYKCHVKIRGKVYFRGELDPNFELKAKLSTPSFYPGDNVNIEVKVSKDAFITVISCDEDGNIHLIYPNKHARNNFLKAGKELNIPNDLSFQLKAFLPKERDEIGEILHIIATKEQPLFLLDFVAETKENGFLTYSLGGLKKLVRQLSKFSREDWTSKVIFYSVKKK